VKSLWLILVVVIQAGCAIVEDEASTKEKREPFTPIETAADSYQVEHGIVTVREVQPRSDIVILPPSMQHVIWQREGLGAEVIENTGVAILPAKTDGAEKRKPRPRDQWPLLEEDMNFDSQVGRVDMCDPMDVCEPSEYCQDLVPCERRDELSCYRVKQGDYCLENEQ